MPPKSISKRIPREGFTLDEAWSLQQPTTEEVANAQQVYRDAGLCDHLYVTFESGWLYDSCDCAICGKFVAMV